MKRVLVTAGAVYGRLDGNKLVGNRVRGIWALKFAAYLAAHSWQEGETYQVTVLVPDTMLRSTIYLYLGGQKDNVKVVYQDGFDDYKAKCEEMALTHDAALMAAAVVNWIPAEPVSGKMVTKGYEVGDRIDIPFYLAPRVINTMRTINPNLTLIGCKMLVGSTDDELLDAAYGVVLKAKCNVVLANDQANGLRRKLLVYQDRTVVEYDDDWLGLYKSLKATIDDVHWSTLRTPMSNEGMKALFPEALALFDRIVDKYRDRFTPRDGGQVFGSLLIPLGNKGFLVSPREKGLQFTSADAVFMYPPNHNTHGLRTVTMDGTATHTAKATLNAPLLARMADVEGVVAVLHLHEQLAGVPTGAYAPPGTARDSDRELLGTTFNIRGHGFIAALDTNLNPIHS